MTDLKQIRKEMDNLNSFIKYMGWDYESYLKRLPDWYGIPGIKFIWHNEWSDPEIEYKGKRCSCYIVEDTMWSFFREETGLNNEDEFAKYMSNHKNVVYELCKLALGLEE